MTMKKKILSLCLVVALAATAVIGGTLAYFSDTDAQKNTFTTGNVAIDLWEDFGDNDETGIEELIPAVIIEDGESTIVKNSIEKEVYVENTGSEDAYVRVHIAIPSILDGGDTVFSENKKALHVVHTDGAWNWTTSIDENIGTLNQYTTTIENISYNVYVVTYKTVLSNGASTVDAINQVYLDPKVTNDDITRIKNTLGNEWHIYVVAEGTQAQGFTDAYDALNTAFGDPATDEGKVTEAEFKATYKDKKWVDTEATVTPTP